jgi:uncharacterized protein
VLGVLCLLVLNLSSARAASFDCSKAKTETEKAVCKDHAIGSLDEILAGRFRVALKTPNNAESIKKSQTLWLRDRNKCSADIDCLFRAYESRNSELFKIISASNAIQNTPLIERRVFRDSAPKHIKTIKKTGTNGKTEEIIFLQTAGHETFKAYGGGELDISITRDLKFDMEVCGDAYELCQSISISLTKKQGGKQTNYQKKLEGKYCGSEPLDQLNNVEPPGLLSKNSLEALALMVNDEVAAVMVSVQDACGNHLTRSSYLMAVAGETVSSRDLNLGELTELIGIRVLQEQGRRQPVAIFAAHRNCRWNRFTTLYPTSLETLLPIRFSSFFRGVNEPWLVEDIVGPTPFKETNVQLDYIDLFLNLKADFTDHKLAKKVLQKFKSFDKEEYGGCLDDVPNTLTALKKYIGTRP